MTVELLEKLSLAAYVLAGVLLLAAAAQFFLFSIPKVIGDLSGSTARKSIEQIRQQNAQTGSLRRERVRKKPEEKSGGKEKKKAQKAAKPASETTLLSTPSAPETTLLTPTAGETEVLVSAASETTLLTPQNGIEAAPVMVEPVEVPAAEATVEVELGFTGSGEVIE